MEIHLQHEIETFRGRVKTACIDADLVFGVLDLKGTLRLPSAAEAENVEAVFLTPFNLVKAVSIALDIFVSAEDL